MIAAIYARKSTEQNGVSDDQKSVARQVEHARSYATRKGWDVDEACVYVDDGISGAEFANRPGFLRLMNALRPRPPFQVLLVSELSRIGREQLETGYAVKQLSQAGVTIVSYIEDRELLLDTPTDKFLMSAVSFAAEIERDKARQRTYDAMARKARAGHVTGGRLFGYDNVDVAGADGERSHVERRINRGEALVVQKIFELCARGEGLKGIAKTLNAGGAPAPRNQQGRSRSWAPSSVREALYRSTYRGLITWNKTKKRDAWGQRNCTDRAEADWLTIPAEQLRIVSDAQWEAAHARLTQRRASYAFWKQGQGGEPDGRGVRRQYFLAGFGRCSCCGASMQVVSRKSGQNGDRNFRYSCASYWNRGSTVCQNGLGADMPIADAAIRQLLRNEVLGRPRVIERALERAVELLQASPARPTRQALERELASVDRELANLADTAARGGAVPVILERLADRDREQKRLRAELARLQGRERPVQNTKALKNELRALLSRWDELLMGNVAEARPVLDDVLTDRIVFQPNRDRHEYELVVSIAFDRVLRTVIPDLRKLPDKGTSPTGFEPVFWP
jgi:site-specific DNA recombinase